MGVNIMEITIDINLVQRLIAAQFPQWRDLTIVPVVESGWDNRTFHLGNDMLVRLPSSSDHALAVEKEQYWLPKLAPHVPLPIPSPIAIGKPDFGYPCHWSINRWLPGEAAAKDNIFSMENFAAALAQFLKALQNIDTKGGPIAGPHSFYRGGPLLIYHHEVKQAPSIRKVVASELN